MKAGKGVLFFLGGLCLLGGIFVIEKKFMEKKTYGYYKEMTEQEKSGDTDEILEEPQTIVNMEVLAEQVIEENVEDKKVFLTFDDGPSEVTKDILRHLGEEGIKATFFLIGAQITEDNEALVQRMWEEGHEIGIHTYTHEKNEIYMSAQTYIDDVIKTADRIEEVTGRRPVYYRFPWGSVNCYICSFREEIIETLAEKGYEYIDWNVSGEDSVGTPSIQTIYDNIKKDYDKFNEPVVLMHDSSANALTAETLPDIIRLFQSAGYQFGAIGERSRPYQWGRNLTE